LIFWVTDFSEHERRSIRVEEGEERGFEIDFPPRNATPASPSISSWPFTISPIRTP